MNRYESMPLVKDTQANKLYAWEVSNVAKYDRGNVPYNNLQFIVDYVWHNEGLKYPPKIEELPKNCCKILADATRLRLRFNKNGAPTWVILHELAHSMTSTIDEISNYHGELFVGVYIKLLNKYLKINIESMIESLNQNNVKFDLSAIPLMLY